MRALAQMLPCTAFLGVLALGPATHAQQPPPAAPAAEPALPAPLPLIPATPSPEAVEAYQQRRLGLTVFIRRSGFGNVTRQIQAHQGPYKRALRTDAFFQELGRPDLAERYRQRRATWRSLMITGGALAGAGIITIVTGVYLYYSPVTSMSTAPDAPPVEKNSAALYAAAGGGLLMAISGTLFTVARYMRVDPISTGEAEALVDAHNRRLRQKLLGLNARDMFRTTTLTPHASPTGAGLTLGMRLW